MRSMGDLAYSENHYCLPATESCGVWLKWPSHSASELQGWSNCFSPRKMACCSELQGATALEFLDTWVQAGPGGGSGVRGRCSCTYHTALASRLAGEPYHRSGPCGDLCEVGHLSWTDLDWLEQNNFLSWTHLLVSLKASLPGPLTSFLSPLGAIWEGDIRESCL